MKTYISIKKLLVLFLIPGIIAVISCNKNDVVNSGVYFPKVKTIIEQNCISCHFQGGQGMPVILTEDADIVKYAASIKASTSDAPTYYNKRMPLGSELSAADKSTISDWVEMGGTSAD